MKAKLFRVSRKLSLTIFSGIALYLIGVFFMSAMDASAKWLTAGYAIVQIVFLKSLFSLIPALLILRNEGVASLVSQRWYLLIARALIACGTVFFFFFALKFLSLAEVASICAVAPLFMTMLSAIFLREQVGYSRWVATIVGLLGALAIIRPGSVTFDPASLLPLGSAFCYAAAMVLSKVLVRTESNVAIWIYNDVTLLCISGMLLPMSWTMPSGNDTIIFFVMGICAGCSTYCRIRACRYAPVHVLAPFDYTALVWAVLFGYMLWRDVPDNWTVFGAIVIVASGVYVLSQHITAIDRKAGATDVR